VAVRRWSSLTRDTGKLKCAEHRRSAAAGLVYVRQSAAAVGITVRNHRRRTGWIRRKVGWRIIVVPSARPAVRRSSSDSEDSNGRELSNGDAVQVIKDLSSRATQRH